MRALKQLLLAVLLCGVALPGWPDEEETLAVIVAPSQAGRLAGLADLALVYRRKRLLWESGERMQPVNLPPEHPLRRVFTQRVLGTTPQGMAEYWSAMYFHGISPPHVMASEEAVLRFVAETPGALGYVYACHADARVKPVLWLLHNGEAVTQPPALKCAEH